MSIKDVAGQVASDPRVSATVAAGMTGTSAAGLFEWLPTSTLHQVGLLVGAVLSVVLIVSNVFNGLIKYKKTRLEYELLLAKTKEGPKSKTPQSATRTHSLPGRKT